MPTEPNHEILWPGFSIAQGGEVLTEAATLLQELVNFASHALLRCFHEPSAQKDEDMAVLALYWHVIGLTDAIQVLVAQCCTSPAVPLVRSSFEALLAMEYILEDDAKYADRALAWIVGYYADRLSFYERLDPATQKGKEFADALKSDPIISPDKLPASATVTKEASEIRELLKKPDLQSMLDKFEAAKWPPPWYSLDDGPKSLHQLAKHLKRGAQYYTLYSWWSLVVHAKDPRPFLAPTPDGDMVPARLRDHKRIREITAYASRFIIDATDHILRRFRPDETLGHWIEKENIQARLEMMKE